MNTKTRTGFTLTIVDGPNRERLMDVFRMQYLEERRPFVEFTLTLGTNDFSSGKVTGPKISATFCPTGIQYEDGSGQSFIIDGHLTFKNKGASATTYVEGYYTTHCRNGWIMIENPSCGYDELEKFVKALFDNR